MGLPQKPDTPIVVIPVLQLQFKQIPESHTTDSVRFRHSTPRALLRFAQGAHALAGMTMTMFFGLIPARHLSSEYFSTRPINSDL
jgi:hypothetical protein